MYLRLLITQPPTKNAPGQGVVETNVISLRQHDLDQVRRFAPAEASQRDPFRAPARPKYMDVQVLIIAENGRASKPLLAQQAGLFSNRPNQVGSKRRRDPRHHAEPTRRFDLFGLTNAQVVIYYKFCIAG
jgi:hypothetical protein